MAEALKLIEVAEDKGFKRRVGFLLMQHAETIVEAVTPDANDLAFAKKLFTNGPNSYVQSFAIILVNGSAGTALEAQGYDHMGVSDSTLLTAVQGHFNTFAKGIV